MSHNSRTVLIEANRLFREGLKHLLTGTRFEVGAEFNTVELALDAGENGVEPQPSPHFSYSEINALPLNGQQAVTAISALWLRRSTAFRWLQQPIGRHLMIDVVEQVIERHPEVKMRGSLSLPASYRNTCQE